MDLTQVIALIVLVFAVLLFVFRKKITVYFTSLAYDYGVDGLFSFLDNFIYGVGLVGLDIGDWFAAGLIFVRQKKITGGFIAFIVAWEAANFLPASLIPGIGESIEIFFNLFPAVTISYFFFNKESEAKEIESNLIQEIGIVDQSGGDSYKAKTHLAEAQKQIEEGNYAVAVNELKKVDLSSKISDYINKFASYVEEKSNMLREEASVAPSEVKESVEKAIRESEAFFEQISSSHSKLEAMNLAREGVTRIESAESNFEKMFSSVKKEVSKEAEETPERSIEKKKEEVVEDTEEKAEKPEKQEVEEEVKNVEEEKPEIKKSEEKEVNNNLFSKLSTKFSETFSKKP